MIYTTLLGRDKDLDPLYSLRIADVENFFLNVSDMQGVFKDFDVFLN